MLREIYRAKGKAAMSWVSQRRYRRLHTVADIAYDFACILFPSFGKGVERSKILFVAVDFDRGALREGNPITFRMLTL
tara:strand:- start:228 stop:461 length:234 start_codon:yes stop_codon:yes gene_type:complete